MIIYSLEELNNLEDKYCYKVKKLSINKCELIFLPKKIFRLTGLVVLNLDDNSLTNIPDE